ncbi:lysine-rich nucleolar protein 1 [Physeter macrocephalus]|uniref:Lysine-rich nucleolar protein 1 n=1 Tax=Physeter macrocephalus TaxID=9755 RepID=A0A455CB81_PHYMC|nr:lysine-rich nucleolar protein 1 [Physeter catodon]
MVTKTHKGDLGLGLPEKKKKKKKKKVVKEPETQYSVLNSDSYFAEVRPTRTTSPSKNMVQEQAPEMPLMKQKKKKKGHSTVCEEPLDPETMLRARRIEPLPSPRKQALGPSESLGREKKKKRKSVSPGSRVKTSPDPRQGEEVTRVGKKLKKHKKEKKVQEATAFSARDSWFCETRDALYTCSVGKGGVPEQAALGQKRKQGSPREHNMKMKKKKKIHQEGDIPLGHPELSRSVESSRRKGSKKKSVKVEAPEYIPIGDDPKAPVKKKMKSKKKAEQADTEEPALKRKKKRQESRVAGEPWEEEPDTDLEVVLEKKGNMDEAHIDQVAVKTKRGRLEGAQQGPARDLCFVSGSRSPACILTLCQQVLAGQKQQGVMWGRPVSWPCCSRREKWRSACKEGGLQDAARKFLTPLGDQFRDREQQVRLHWPAARLLRTGPGVGDPATT